MRYINLRLTYLLTYLLYSTTLMQRPGKQEKTLKRTYAKREDRQSILRLRARTRNYVRWNYS